MFAACDVAKKEKPSVTLFKLLSSEESGVDFVNQLDYTEELNTYTFKNFYNGGGVGLGDFNKDGFLDIFLSGNLVTNKLYLNKGKLPSGNAGFHFEDITEIGRASCRERV